jgi:hypothetical protein
MIHRVSVHIRIQLLDLIRQLIMQPHPDRMHGCQRDVLVHPLVPGGKAWHLLLPLDLHAVLVGGVVGQVRFARRREDTHSELADVGGEVPELLGHGGGAAVEVGGVREGGDLVELLPDLEEPVAAGGGRAGEGEAGGRGDAWVIIRDGDGEAGGIVFADTRWKIIKT